MRFYLLGEILKLTHHYDINSYVLSISLGDRAVLLEILVFWVF